MKITVSVMMFASAFTAVPALATAPLNALAVAIQPEEDGTIHKVVVNAEQQYSLWPANRENPDGWTDVGFQGTRSECLEYIDNIWKDMRPPELRRQQEQAE